VGRRTLRILARERPLLVGHVVLALGIALMATIGAFTDRYVFRPVPVAGFEQVVRIGGLSFPTYADLIGWWKQAHGLEALARYETGTVRLEASGQTRIVRAAAITSEYFNAVGFVPQWGRLIAEAEHEVRAPVVVLSEITARSLFGRPELAVGERIQLSSTAAEVIGVIAVPSRVPIRAELWVVGGTTPESDPRILTDHDSGWLARLRPGVEPSAIRQEFMRLLALLNAEEGPRSGTNYGNTVSVTTLAEVAARPYRGAFVASLAGAGLVLFMALVTSTTLSLGQALEARATIALKVALGAAPWGLVRQQISHAFLRAALLGTVGWLLALVAAFGLERSIASTAGAATTDLERPLNLSLAWIVGGATLIAGICMAFPAAVSAATFSRPHSSMSKPRIPLRAALLAAQCAMAAVLTVATVHFWQSATAFVSATTTMASRDVLVAEVLFNEDYSSAVFKSIYNDTGKRIALTSAVPYLDSPGRIVVESEREGSMADLYYVIGPVPEILGLSLELSAADAATDTGVIVSRTLADRLWPKSSPIGQAVRLGGRETPLFVTGVVSDVVVDVTWSSGGQLYLTAPALFASARRGAPMSLLAECGGNCEGYERVLRGAIERVGGQIASVTWMSRELAALAEPASVRARVATLFGATGFMLAAGGVFSLVMFMVLATRRDLAIRAALGASPLRVAYSITLVGLRPMALGVGAGILASVPVLSAARAVFVGLAGTSVMTYVAAVMILFAGGAVACIGPVRQALAVDVRGELMSE
jgi:putative ABC transport system permease protein